MNPNGGQTNPAPAQPAVPNPEAAARPAPVMDVVAPIGDVTPQPATSLPLAMPPDEPAEMAPAQPEESPERLIQDDASLAGEAPSRVQVKSPKQPGSGVGLAIFATVLIVLALAALATYAYMQSQ